MSCYREYFISVHIRHMQINTCILETIPVKYTNVYIHGAQSVWYSMLPIIRPADQKYCQRLNSTKLGLICLILFCTRLGYELMVGAFPLK